MKYVLAFCLLFVMSCSKPQPQDQQPKNMYLQDTAGNVTRTLVFRSDTADFFVMYVDNDSYVKVDSVHRVVKGYGSFSIKDFYDPRTVNFEWYRYDWKKADYKIVLSIWDKKSLPVTGVSR